MISWVRDRVATRWIQTRKRGGDGSAATGQTDDDEDDEEDSSRNVHLNGTSFHDSEDISDDEDEQQNTYTCPHSPRQRNQSSRPPDVLSTNNSKSQTNRRSRSEKRNSKLEIRKKPSVTSSCVVEAGPSSAPGSPVTVHQTPPPPASPASHNNSPRASSSSSSFGFLSRRFFSGGGGASARNRPITTTTSPPPVVLLSHNANRDASNYYRPQSQQFNGRDTNNGQAMSLLSSSAPPTPIQPPKGISTNTGTISKLSSSANCTRGFKSSITVRVISIRGGFIDVTFPITKTGKELKLEAMGRFAVDTNALPLSHSTANLQSSLAKYRLVTMNRRDVIDEELTLDKLGLRDKDQLLLAVKRNGDDGKDSPGTTVDKRKAALEEEYLLRGPSVKDIQRATEHLPATEQTPPKVNIDDMVLQTDLQYDIRKILISLAQSSAYVIGAGPYADRLILMLKQRLINRRKTETDSLNCLLDMGFAKPKAVYALKLKEFVYADALRWLIENPRQEVPTLEEMETKDLFEQIQPSTSINEGKLEEGTIATGGGEEQVEEQAVNSKEEEDSAEEHEKRVLEAGLNSFNSRKDYIETLLEIIRIHSQRDLPVNDEMVAKLMEMGFVEEEVREALKITQNNQAAACEWLIGSRSKSLTELRDGLPENSPILRALLASPQVQISLGNPKMLLAYLSMLENYSSMNMWLSDTDTSGVLGHILRTYHEEKHIVAINQFSIVL